MLSLAKAAKDYYLRKLGEVSPREDYYLRGGTATGAWRGSGAAELGLEGVVSAEGLVRLFDGQHPVTGERLGRRLRKDGVAAWDLTFSADKSVSLLWALGDVETRREVLAAFDEATGAALSYLESVASSTRGAARAPVVDEKGRPLLDEDGTPRHRVETWPIRTTGYVAAWFTEFTSRADDPQVHTHVVVGNRVKGVDGVWRALDGRLLYTHRLAAGYLHEAVLRRRLTERLGVRWQPVTKGMADIEGFTRDQIRAFSQRRQEIEAWRESNGLGDSPAANRAAAIATRDPKRDHLLDQLLPSWRVRAEEVGLTPEAIARVMGHSREITRPPLPALAGKLTSPQGLTAKESTFSRADVIKELAAALPEGGTREEIEGLADAFLQHREVLPILPVQRVPVGVDLLALTDEERRLVRRLAEDARLAAPMRRRDGTYFPGLVHERRYTTAELVATEQRIIDRALAGIGGGRWTAPSGLVEAALAARRELTEGQREMVSRFATSGDAVEVGVGPAGTGKTTVMAVIADLAAQTGTPIVGAALAARAAAGLQAATGIPSFTLTRLLGEAGDSGGLAAGGLVVVDEAGMVGTRHLAAVSDLVEAAGGKLILVGDHHQLPEIEAGGLFRALAHRLPAVELTENIRQTHPWERAALAELREGSPQRAVAAYHQRGRIDLAVTPQDTLTRAVDAWHHDLTAGLDPAGVLLLAHHNLTVTHLNQAARQRMTAMGRLTGPTLTVGDLQLQAGDRVLCLKNQRRVGVLNGDLATITSLDPANKTVTVRLDRADQTRTLPAWYLEEGHLGYGYALTGHKAQGVTTERVHVVIGDGVSREWAYVAVSRGRDANTIHHLHPHPDGDCTHLPHQHPHQLTALASALNTSHAQTAAVDAGRGPRLLTDPELAQRRQQLEQDLTQPPAAGVDPRRRQLEEYLALTREAHHRRADTLAAIAYQPPAWITVRLGERPADPDQARVWDLAVDKMLLGHQPTLGEAGDPPRRREPPGRAIG